ncbi:MAG: hypothetical protein AAF485_19410, partial [Chloroflexota bacterium]
VTMPAGDDEATIYSTPLPANKSAQKSMMPILIGGGVVGLLLVLGVLGFVFLGRDNSTPTPTEDTVALAAAENETATAQAELDNEAATAEAQNAQASADATATAEALAPTQTAQAIAEATEAVIAKQTADALLIETALGAQAGTATAIALEAQIAADSATAEADSATAEADSATAEALANATPTPEPTATEIPPTPTLGLPTNTPEPTATPTPDVPPITGKLAFPVDDGAGKYDVQIVSLPEGNEVGLIKGARQPFFRNDGVKLLVNGSGGSFGENVFEASPSGSIDRVVSSSPTDSFATYNPAGQRIAYSNPQLALGTDGVYHSYIFVQCNILPPEQEGDPNCKDIARFGILVPNGQIGEVQGSHPIWTADDRIVYKGCDSWKGGGSCGIYIGVSWGTKRDGNGNTPVKIADGGNIFPTDSKGSLIAYQSRESGNWEAYVMNLDGSGAVNISNSPNSSDGLGTISPDGQWVAFASDREGTWAIYATPVSGGEAIKILDFPKGNPWATGDRDWTNERISWGQ